MDDREIFQTLCWNFIGGDRQIERILRDLPPRQPLVVRNRLAHVLPTVAAIADLALPVAVRVPENALEERAVALDEPVTDFYGAMLERLYGIRVEGGDRPAGPDDLLIAIGYTTDEEAAPLAAWLSHQGPIAVVFLVPPGAELASVLRPHAVSAWSAQRVGAVNGFSVPTVEEAVAEREPARIWVASPREAAMAYTAIGAVDWLIREGSRLQELDGRAIRQLGKRVSALRFEAPATTTPTPFRALALAHLREALGVTDTEADARFRVTAEAIAIDIA